MKTLLQTVFAALLLSACGDGSDRGIDWVNDGAVLTLSGPVSGQSDASNTWVWRSIPYAAPPVGDLRWKAPRDPASWAEPLSNDVYGDRCVQYDQAGVEIIGSEDCLTLNVWRPQSDERDLPVYVWIHGGGNSSGVSSEANYLGANLANTSNIVFVSMNYRLGPLGWFYNEVLHDGDADTDSGNFGTLDIIKSLEWIRDNIERFGGDADNVFVTGESAGGINVLSLLLSPRAEGLFDKAMSQSGFLPPVTLEQAAEFSQELLPDLFIQQGLAVDRASAELQIAEMPDEDLATTLRNISPENLYAPIRQTLAGLLAAPFIWDDGHVIVAGGPNTFATGAYPNKVPLVLGTNSGDVRLFLTVFDSGLSADPLLYNAISDIGGQLWKAEGADDIARSIADFTDQPDVYVYSFEWGKYQDSGGLTPVPFNYLMGSAHSLDIPFFLDTLDEPSQLTSILFNEANRESRELLSAYMIRYMQNFHLTGNPNGPDVPWDWLPWSNAEGSPKSIILDADFTDLQLRTDFEGVSKQGALQSIEDIADVSLRQQVSDYLLDFDITCTFVAEDPAVECN